MKCSRDRVTDYMTQKFFGLLLIFDIISNLHYNQLRRTIMRKLIHVVTVIAALCLAISGHDAQAQNGSGYTLTVKVYRTGTWLGGVGEWIEGATVTVSKSGFNTQTQTTNANGIATFYNIPQSYGYTILASKAGCGQNTRVYNMGAYNSNVNLDLECAPKAGAYSLTVKVLDAKGTHCGSGPQYLSGATVRLKQGAAVLQTATSNNNGSVTFQNVVAGTYLLNADRNNCTQAEVTYNMPGQNSETTVSLPNCYTTNTYDIIATMSQDPKKAKAGKNIAFGLQIKNQGPNGPSKNSTITLRRYSVSSNGQVSNYGVQVDRPKNLPSLCNGETTNFTFIDRSVPAGTYQYKISYSSPINDANNNNHLAELTVQVYQ